MRLRRALAAALVLGLTGPGAGLAQDTLPTPPDAAVASLILTVDTERAFSTSLYGVRLETDIKTAADALVAENTKIEKELGAEELALTEERATLDPVEFRKKADAFDTKVQKIRAEQDAKARDVQSMRDKGQRNFLTAVTPILAEIARERGAVLVFERQQILLSAESIDVTSEAIERLNARLSAEGELSGEEAATPAEQPAPEPSRDTNPDTTKP